MFNSNIYSLKPCKMASVIKNKKQALGQFFTTNQEYILQGLFIPDDVVSVIEPFAGNGDLIPFIENFRSKRNEMNKQVVIEYYDIEPNRPFIVQQDTILNPPNYRDKFIITNPPYLARNKSKDKHLFDKYGVNDLYKCMIKEITQSNNTCCGGILIVPLNFWSSIRLADMELRKAFLEKYSVIMLNIFEETVFEDTTYTICSFQFTAKTDIYLPNRVIAKVFPSKTVIETVLSEKNNYMIGGEIYRLPLKNTYRITRLTSKNREKANTCILVKCIDDNQNSQIGLSIVEPDKIYVDETPNQTARTYACLIIEPPIGPEQQADLVVNFNSYLEFQRRQFCSLFLTNYRESKDIARKRISFDLVYSLVGYILDREPTVPL